MSADVMCISDFMSRNKNVLESNINLVLQIEGESRKKYKILGCLFVVVGLLIYTLFKSLRKVN